MKLNIDTRKFIKNIDKNPKAYTKMDYSKNFLLYRFSRVLYKRHIKA